MAARTPPPAPRNPTLAVGVATLVIGFVAGTLVGRESARAPGARAPAAHAAQDGHDHDHAHDAPAQGQAGAHGVARGHTFTGNVSTPPHGPESHDLAGKVVAGVQCPCGGCGGMDLAACTCDVAKEIQGVVAHLLERGTTGDTVLRDLEGHYGLALSPETLARAATLKFAGAAPATRPDPAAPARAASGLPAGDVADFLQGGPAPQRPRDVPTSARGN